MSVVDGPSQLSSRKRTVPVRVLDANSVLQGSVLLTPSGVVVRCNHPPRVDTVVAVKIELPERRDPLSVRAIVRQSIDSGCAKGFRAEFTELDREARSAIALHLLGSSLAGVSGKSAAAA
jgi:hypothetical protein